MHALDRMNQIYPTAQSPPAISRRFQKTKSRQPGRAVNRRGIAGHAAANQFEAHQRKPVLDPGEVDEASMPGMR